MMQLVLLLKTAIGESLPGNALLDRLPGRRNARKCKVKVGVRGNAQKPQRRRGQKKKPDFAKCTALHEAYKKVQKKPGCGRAKDCNELKISMANLSKQSALRLAYIKADCDRIEWVGSRDPNNPQARKRRHQREFRRSIGQKPGDNPWEKCWRKYHSLKCKFKLTSGF